MEGPGAGAGADTDSVAAVATARFAAALEAASGAVGFGAGGFDAVGFGVAGRGAVGFAAVGSGVAGFGVVRRRGGGALPVKRGLQKHTDAKTDPDAVAGRTPRWSWLAAAATSRLERRCLVAYLVPTAGDE